MGPEPREVEPYFLLPRTYDPEGLADDEPDYDWPEGEQLINVVVVRVSQGGRTDEFDAADDSYGRGDDVVVETDKGLELGTVSVGSRRAMRPVGALPRVIRRTTANDHRKEDQHLESGRVAFALCKELIGKHRLAMKLISVDYLHGGNRAVFFFASEGRVDFRQLVRELASKLHTRVEMRQVGVRDAARLVGGLGPCGMQLCCNGFLSRFAPVSIRMAKDQNLVLNPQKVSGVCGRLMCCLTYEQEAYVAARKGMPKLGKRVTLKDGGSGRVRDLDVLARKARVQLEDGTYIVVGPDDVVPNRPDGGGGSGGGRRDGGGREQPSRGRAEKSEPPARDKGERRRRPSAKGRGERAPSEEPAPKAESAPSEEPAPKAESAPSEEPAPKAESEPAEESPEGARQPSPEDPQDEP